MSFPRASATIVATSFLLLGGCAGIAVDHAAEETDKQQSAMTNRSVADAQAAEAAQETPAPPVRRALPELVFSDVDLSGFSTTDANPGYFDDPDTASQHPADLWQRLRRGFRLSNLEAAPGRVEKFEKWYAKHPKYFDRLADRAYWFLPYVLAEVEKRGMPAEIAILPAIESAFRPDATSRSNAAGMWQFIHSTGRRFGLRQDWWMDGRRDLAQSTRAALDYLEYLADEFDGDWELALAAYNAGEGTIGRAVRKNRKYKKPAGYVHLKLRKETAEYLPRLFAVRNVIADPARFGISLRPLANAQTVKVVDLQFQTDISVASSFISLNRKQLQFLNLGYRRGVTPPNGPHTLVVPADDAVKIVAELNNLNPTQRMQWAHHKVKKGEVLGGIAQLHGVTVQSIQRANAMGGSMISIGQELRIPLSTGPSRFAGPVLKSANSKPRQHLVARGDTLWRIARRYGVTVSTLLHTNQISSRTTLYPGQSLLVSE